MSLKISVVVPTYKRPDLLKKCLKSLTTQTYENLQVVVVDDGSPDNTAEVMQKIIEENPGKEIVYYKHPQNVGLAKNWGKGLFEIADGDVKMILNDDDFFAVDSVVADVASKFDQNPNVGMVTASQKMYFPDTDQYVDDKLFLPKNCKAHWLINHYWDRYGGATIHMPAATTFFRSDLLDSNFMLQDPELISTDAELFMMILFHAAKKGLLVDILDYPASIYLQNPVSASTNSNIDILWRDAQYLENVVNYALYLGFTREEMEEWLWTRNQKGIKGQIKFLTERKVCLNMPFGLKDFFYYFQLAAKMRPKFFYLIFHPKVIAYYILSLFPPLYKKLLVRGTA